MIEGVIITPLKQIKDDRGKVMHMLRSDWDLFEDFGEIYFSNVNPGIVKGWKKHTRMIQNLVCIVGNMRLVIYDDRDDSNTKGEVQEIVFGEDNYCLVTIHPGVWMGFASVDNQKSMLANCASIVHDPQESITIPWDDTYIPYSWEVLI